MTADLRRCDKCGRDLPAHAFSRNRRSNDGLLKTCRQCVAFGRSCRKHQRRDEPEQMTCRLCNVEKPSSEFYRNTEGSLMRQCKACYNARQRERIVRNSQDPEWAAQYRKKRTLSTRSARLRQTAKSLFGKQD